MRDFYLRLMSEQIPGFWAGFLKSILWGFSFIYRTIVIIRNRWYDKGILPVIDVGNPVISVGNLTWGGVGKTPCVSYLAQYVLTRKAHPVILTRGYRWSRGDGKAFSDEAQMLQRENPSVRVEVGGDRVQSALKVRASDLMVVFILDDGYQYRRMKRDLNILLIDSTNPFGNEALIPRGILRESIAQLHRADVIILTKTDINPSLAQTLEERLKKMIPGCLTAWAVHQPQDFSDLLTERKISLSEIRPQDMLNVISFCSIGDPDGFQETLTRLGIASIHHYSYTDHYHYNEDDIHELIQKAQAKGAKRLVTTAKDAVKLVPFKNYFSSMPCWILNITFEMKSGKDKVLERIDHLLGC